MWERRFFQRRSEEDRRRGERRVRQITVISERRSGEDRRRAERRVVVDRRQPPEQYPSQG